ncbi:serine hydrolase [Sphingobacterium sp. UT-1RO-CII-1]|uniref:serine hydrolase domain-containing protein n=1 Tax=Sphingobacterium sp. UT-1RO-CII-1 TaxID=2995225 RepID=UPI00227BF6B9|nr:serine hydrolase [Sphingobacterium sp. UT-1RO-CII-1]MCY4779373.1 serine hydrolase [Sphingobacterium sp. UT-1RO-CII-1]
MKNIFIIFFASFLLFSCQYGHKSEKSQRLADDALTKSLELAYRKDGIRGFSVAVVDEKGLVYNKGFGFASLDQIKAYTAHSTQNIASISKTLIGVALLKAQELGKLNINDPINDYLPFKVVNPHYPEIPILIKHLAYHTSSINDLDEVYAKSYVLSKDQHDENEGVYDYFNKPETHISLKDFMLNSLTQGGKWYQKSTFLDSKPGEKREYSNIGAALCALVIESAVEQDYRIFTRNYIMQPLEMNSSGWSVGDIDSLGRSRLFAYKGKMIAEYSLITYADGGLVTSSHDMGLFLSELIKGCNGSGKLLTKESYNTLFEKQRFIDQDETEEYGVFMEFRNDFLQVKNDMIGHNGSDPGVFTAMYFNPTTKVGKVVLVNTDTDFTDIVWPEIEEIWKSLSDYESMISK